MRSVALSPPKAILALMLGLAAALLSLFLTPPELWPASLGLALPLAWAAMVDIDRLILPDVITLPLIGIGLAYAAAFDLPALLDAIAGAVAGYAALTLVALAYRRLRRRNGLGQGDAKLLAAGGAWLSWAALPAILLIASGAAIVYIAARQLVRREIGSEQPIAFGPFIALGVWLVWLMRAGGSELPWLAFA